MCLFYCALNVHNSHNDTFLQSYVWVFSSGPFFFTERLDEMLASQESMMRSQPSEADYRAATVKQRPTSRRITPAEISVSAPTQYMAPCWHT